MIKIFFFVFILFLSFQVNAYGVLHYAFDRSEDGYFSYLIENVLSKKSIHVAYEISDQNKFPQWSMEVQTKVALDFWLEPLKKAGIPIPKYVKVERNDPNLDLLIKIAPDRGMPSNGSAFQRSTSRKNGGCFSEVVINPNHFIHDEGRKIVMSDTRQTIHKLKEFNPKNHLVGQLIAASRRYQSVAKLAEAAKVAYYDVWNSTFPTILHEMGHAFGLADTSPRMKLLVPQTIDPQLRNSKQGDGIMNEADYLLPQDDDRRGIVFAAKKLRFRTTCPSLLAHLNKLVKAGW